ncbi:MAG: hypothetical protein VYD19_09780 [Myxococcota bacterium]|nr:hypothetical protein [Myxococcota bacterium]
MGYFPHLLLASLSLTLSGCVAEEVSMELVGVRKFDPVTCQVEFNKDEYVALGLMDLVVAQNYVANLEVRNRLEDNVALNNQTNSDGRVNTNNVTLQEVELSYRDVEGVGLELEPQRIVEIGQQLSSESDAKLAIGIELITPAMATALIENQELFFNDAGTALARRSVKVEVSLQVRGVTFDGGEVESNRLNFPLSICTGCLISFPPELLRDEGGQTVCQIRTSEGENEDLCAPILGRDGNAVPCDLCQLFAVNEQSRPLCQP